MRGSVRVYANGTPGLTALFEEMAAEWRGGMARKPGNPLKATSCFMRRTTGSGGGLTRAGMCW
jgi:hypothetical protein